MKKRYQPLPWYGGKAGYGKAKWIASLLPCRKDSVYVEPFGGMAGVLVNRTPVKLEIFNDLDNRIVNWWRVVRNNREEFGKMVETLHHSRTEHEWAKVAVDDASLPDIDRALAFHCIVLQSVLRNVSGSGYWIRDTSKRTIARWRSERVAVLAERMWNVQLECIDACELLEKTIPRLRKEDVIYCDPPYRTMSTHAYLHENVDIERLTNLLVACSAHVAISGVGDEWAHLGWMKHEKEILRGPVPGRASSKLRVEVLWTNYVPTTNSPHSQSLPLTL